jgi:hypothetical protein
MFELVCRGGGQACDQVWPESVVPVIAQPRGYVERIASGGSC